MFWILKAEAPAGDPGQVLSGSSGKLGPFTLKAPGTYKVGRKDSDISINDRAVSRHHADIVVGPLGPRPDPAISGTAVGRTKAPADWISIWRPSIKVKDVSKYGTAVYDRSGTKKQSDTPDRSAELNEGDLVIFLHCKVHFRLDCKPVIACVSSVVESERRQHLTDSLKSAGAGVVNQWSDFATHLVVDDGAHCNDEIVAAVSAGIHVVHSRWAEALAMRQTVLDVVPREEEYLPTLLLQSANDKKKHGSAAEAILLTRIQLARQNIIQRALEGWSFVIGARQLYRNSLLELVTAAGGTIRSFEEVLGPEKAPRESRLLLMKPTLDTSIYNMVIPSALTVFARSLPFTSQDRVLVAALSGKATEYQLEVAAPSRSSLADVNAEKEGVAISDEIAQNSAKMVSSYAVEEKVKVLGCAEEAKGAQSGKQGQKRMREDQARAGGGVVASATGSAGVHSQVLLSQMVKNEPWTEGPPLGSESQLVDTGVQRRRVSLKEILQKRQKVGESPCPLTASPAAVTTAMQSATIGTDVVQGRAGTDSPLRCSPAVWDGPRNRTTFSMPPLQVEGVEECKNMSLPDGKTEKGTGDRPRFLSHTAKEKELNMQKMERELSDPAIETPPCPGSMGKTANVKSGEEQCEKMTSDNKMKAEPVPDIGLPAAASKAAVVCKTLIVVRDFPEKLSSQVMNKHGQGAKVVNFKHFRKVQALAPPGNSFECLVPIAKEPYRDVDHTEEAERFMRQEKQRREEERLADELFRADKLKRVKAASRAPLGEHLPSSGPQRGKGGSSKARARQR